MARSNFNFSRVPSASIQRSSFDRSFQHKTTFDAGFLIPVFVDEALPGDTFNVSMTGFARLATPLHPFMDNLYIDSFFFAVPIRLVWDNWEKFNGAQDNPDDSTDYIMPTITAFSGYAVGSIYDYMGLPTGIAGIKHRADFFRAYNLIWNEWFRDENLQDSTTVLKTDGPDPEANYVLKKRGKRHDYFTSALPWPQKGPSVPLPLTGDAPVKGIGQDAASSSYPLANQNVREAGAVTRSYLASSNPQAQNWRFEQDPDNVGFPGIFADLSAVTAATINELRQAFQIQKLYERDARGGTRYTEIIRSHFGVVSPDARLQRPEYLGGGSSPVNVSAIAQSSGTAGAGAYTPTPQGNLAGVGTANMSRHGFTKSFTEHCVIIGMVCARADLTYQQGMARMWSRSTRWDFYWPALAHIGEQAVLNKEIYTQGNSTDDEVFGYQERWAEYRYKPSQISGKFRSSDPQSLDTWHLAQDFGTLPVLGAQFIEENPPVKRVIAVQTEPDFLFDSYFRMRCSRPMPVYSVPGLIDHF